MISNLIPNINLPIEDKLYDLKDKYERLKSKIHNQSNHIISKHHFLNDKENDIINKIKKYKNTK